jgi:hypothetical protein
LVTLTSFTYSVNCSCITQVNSVPYTNPYGVLGTAPAFSPAILFNVRARYDFNFGDYKPLLMVGANHTPSMRNEPAYELGCQHEHRVVSVHQVGSAAASAC